jgi:uncharacterized protein
MKKTLLIIFSFTSFLFAKVHIVQEDFIVEKPINSWIEIKNKNLTRQKYDYSCGSASLSTILKYYYNLDIGEKDILNSILETKGINKKKLEELEEEDFSLSFLDLVNYSNQKGFKAIGLALDFESLSKLKAPVILYVKIRKNEHFTIYKNIDKHYVYLADPSFGNIKVRIQKFKEMFYQREDLNYPGKLLAIVPVTSEQKQKINTSFMKVEENSNFVYDSILDQMLPRK